MKLYNVVPYGSGAYDIASKFTNSLAIAKKWAKQMLAKGANGVDIYNTKTGTFHKLDNPSKVKKGSWMKVKAVKFNRNGSVSIKK